MARILSLLLTLALALPMSACARSPYESQASRMSKVVVVLDIETAKGKGHCSGTAVSPSVILTASHCFQAPLVKLSVNGQEVKALRGVDDESDHTLVVLDRPVFTRWARLEMRQLRQGEEVSILGNPGSWRSLYRAGLVAGDDNEPPVPGSQFIDIQIFGGDSGSGVFDYRGRLVGVISYTKNQVNPRSLGQIAMAGVLPIKFTREQLNEAGVR